MNPWLRLVRAPAALTVLGDAVAGAAASGQGLRGRRLALPLASVSLYWAGMALNDWADRELDATERPDRPIPSGAVKPDEALAVAGVLTATGLGLAAFAGGRRTLRVAVPLAAAIWAYDLVLKSTPAGPAGMALCRGLDVLLGADKGGKAVGLTAAAVATHTLGLTVLSRDEVHGGSGDAAIAALATTATSTVLTLTAPARSWRDRLVALVPQAIYAATVAMAQMDAAGQPSAQKVRKATVAGIHGLVPLQAAAVARAGQTGWAGAVLALWPLAGKLGRRVSPT